MDIRQFMNWKNFRQKIENWGLAPAQANGVQKVCERPFAWHRQLPVKDKLNFDAALCDPTTGS